MSTVRRSGESPRAPVHHGQTEIQPASPQAERPQRTQELALAALPLQRQSVSAGTSLPPRAALLSPRAEPSVQPARAEVPSGGPAGNPRTDLQQALKRLKPNDPVSQAAAHDAALIYSKNPGSLASHVVPVLHKALQLGGSGTMPTFGVALNAGIGLADVAGAAIAGHDLHQQAGWKPGQPAVPLAATPALAIAEWVAGSATGAVGNMLGQKYLKPLTDRVNVQYAAIDPKALLTDEMKAQMNSLKPGSPGQPGWGDRMEQEIKQKQGSATAINSPQNVRIGQAWFAAATAVRVLAQAGEPEGFGRTVAAGALVSTLAGAAIGGTMAANQGRESIRLPDKDKLAEMFELQQAPGPSNRPPANPDSLPTDTLKLFYPKANEKVAAAPAGAAGAPGAAAVSGSPQLSLLQHAEINTASWAKRAWLLGAATTGKTLAAATGPALASLMPNKGLEVVVRAAVASAGIGTAIPPWFKAVGGQIKAFDDTKKADVAARNQTRLGQPVAQTAALQDVPAAVAAEEGRAGSASGNRSSLAGS
jgi:hypothetical protein